MTDQEIKDLFTLLKEQASGCVEINGKLYPALQISYRDFVAYAPANLPEWEVVLDMIYGEGGWVHLVRSWTLDDLREATIEGDTLRIGEDAIRFFATYPIQLKEPTLD